jgi:predicted enzyme related to lactoylglutathione lyase
MWKPVALAVSIAALGTLGLAAARPAAEAKPIEWDKTLIFAFEVPDVRKAAEWYERTLGCERVLDLADMGWIEVSTPVEGALIGLGTPKPGMEVQSNGGSALSFGVKDAVSVRAELAQRGAKVGEIMEIPETVKLLEFEDPWGNHLMLHQSLMHE